MGQNEIAILKTICYSDIFDYPLKKEEIWKYLISHKTLVVSRKSEFENSLKQLIRERKLEQKDSYYFLKGREKIVGVRKIRTKISQSKMLLAEKICKILSKIPTVEFIGISGSVAVMNAKEDADIDLFIITKKNSLWITRIIILICLQIKKLRRKRNWDKAANRICVNMLLDTSNLAFPKNRKDIYTAHEIFQMKPIFSRGENYENFLRNNNWIKDFMSNFFSQQAFLSKTENALNILISKYLNIFEPIARNFQLWYMRNHKTSETIDKDFVAFHPFDYRKEVLNKWNGLLNKYGL